MKKAVRFYEPEECIVHFRTDQGVKIQKLFETLAPLLVEENLVFNKNGIEMRSLSGVLYATFQLKAQNMNQYKCDREVVTGVSLPMLFKYFKAITQNDAVAIQITQESIEAAVPHMFVHICTGSVTYSYRYTLLSLDHVPFDVPEKEFDSIVRINSGAFLRALRSCEQVGECIQIMSKVNTNEEGQEQVAVYIVCEGMLSDLQVTITSEENTPTAEDVADVMNTSDKRERYSLKSLNYIAKATSLNNTVQLFLATDYALIVRYRVGKLGHLTFGLPPKFESSDITIADIDGSTDASHITSSKRKLPLHDDSHPLPEVFLRKCSKNTKRQRRSRRNGNDDDDTHMDDDDDVNNNDDDHNDDHHDEEDHDEAAQEDFDED